MRRILTTTLERWDATPPRTRARNCRATRPIRSPLDFPRVPPFNRSVRNFQAYRAATRAASGVAKAALLVASLTVTSACTTLTYVTQAAIGQDDLNRRARDIDSLVREERVDARMRRLLSSVVSMKRFGEAHGLKATKNYVKYVRVDRPAVVWVASAADPLAFRSKSWAFPLVGSFTYLGWFKLDEARAFAEGLRREGLDVDVRGAGAYSTAGFFEDAVLSTMVPPGKEAMGQLANTILHESAHATFFVHGQSTLNESVANFVGDKLGERYVTETLGEGAPETVAYLASERRNERRGKAMRAVYKELQALYASGRSDAEKLAAKAAIVDRLRTELAYRRPINNATLIQYKTYNSGQDELAALLVTCGGEWPRFIQSLKRLETTKHPRAQESDIGKLVQPLVDAGCPTSPT
jgi:predicted aminopeptidase